MLCMAASVSRIYASGSEASRCREERRSRYFRHVGDTDHRAPRKLSSKNRPRTAAHLRLTRCRVAPYCPAMLERRAFLAGVAAVVVGPRTAGAQRAAKVWTVAFLDEVSGRSVPWIAAFEHRLRDLGYIDGENLAFIFRSAGGRVDRITQLATELVRSNPDVIVNLGGPEGARAVKQQTTTIPVVFSAIEWDPVAAGVVASLVRPGGNLTGISALAVELAGKRLELLTELVPGAKRIAVLWHKARAADQFRVLDQAADVLKLNVVSVEVEGLANDLDTSFARAARERVSAVLVLGSPVFFPQRKQLADLGLRYRLPTSFQRPAYAEAGGLTSYGPDIDDILRHVADYVDRILKGAKPADLPVEQPTKFELVINLKTAKALGLTI